MGDYHNRQLWACGFNAWGQLKFDQEEIDWAHPPEDFQVWQKIYDAEELVFVRGGVNSVLILVGGLGEAKLSKQPDNLESFISYLHESSWTNGNSKPKDYNSSSNLERAAKNIIAVNDTKICVVNSRGKKGAKISETPAIQRLDEVTIDVYGSRNDCDAITLLRDHEPETSFPVPEIRQLVANHTAFHALTVDGKVLSWGDGRFVGVLGRAVTLENPADRPSIIPTLGEDPIGPIRKIAAGFNFTAAITSTNDLYTWGYRSDGPGLMPFFESWTGQPESVDVHGYDILDVACGKNYMLVLTTEHRLFVIGTNANGQLSLGDEESSAEWKEVVLPLPEGAKLTSVQTGYKNSFVIADIPQKPTVIKGVQLETTLVVPSSNTATSEVKDQLGEV